MLRHRRGCAAAHKLKNTVVFKMSRLHWESLSPLPDALGFAGMFGGASADAILCAGGANFSDRPMSEGGKRVWHDDVFAFDEGLGWRKVGRLPAPRGYGVSGSWRGAIAMVGGNDGVRAAAEGWLLRWNGDRLDCEELPSLPLPVTGACGTVVGDQLMVAGGQTELDGTAALARCFSCNLAAPRRSWTELPWPEGAPGRVLAVAGASDGWFYFFSGAALSADANQKPVRRYLTDAWRYREAVGWERLPEMPRPTAAAPSPALAVCEGELIVAGGIWAEYLAAAEAAKEYPGFSREFLIYSAAARQWRAEPCPAPLRESPGRLVAPAFPWRGGWAIVTGEVRPGFRTVAAEKWTVGR
jgi:N-acetylneuraminate epimerase